jgi:hypothetical protein
MGKMPSKFVLANILILNVFLLRTKVGVSKAWYNGMNEQISRVVGIDETP